MDSERLVLGASPDCMEIATILLLLPPGPGFRCDFILLVCTNKSWHGGFELNQALLIQYIFTTSTSKLNPVFLITVDLRQKVDPAQYHLNEYCSSWRVLVWMLCSSWNTMNDCENFFNLWSAAVLIVNFLLLGAVSSVFSWSLRWFSEFFLELWWSFWILIECLDGGSEFF